MLMRLVLVLVLERLSLLGLVVVGERQRRGARTQLEGRGRLLDHRRGTGAGGRGVESREHRIPLGRRVATVQRLDETFEAAGLGEEVSPLDEFLAEVEERSLGDFDRGSDSSSH